MIPKVSFGWVFGLVFSVQASAQEINREFSTRFTNQQPETALFLNGNVDFNNTFVQLPESYFAQFFDLKGYQAYQNLHSIKLTNLGHHPVRRPFIRINNSAFWWEPSDFEKDLEFDSSSFDESALLLWSHFTDKALHRLYPYSRGSNQYRAGTPVEVMSGFGYGICYNKSSAIARLPGNENKFFYSMIWDKHAISEYKSGSQSAIIDTDVKVFYKDFGNAKLSNRNAVALDRYLIRRTHHFGKQYVYDKRVNEYIANLYSLNNINYFLNNNKAVVAPQDFSLDYDLLPGETMMLKYDSAIAWFAEDPYQGVTSELANGSFAYDWNASSNNILTQPVNLDNLQINQWIDEGISKSRLVKIDPDQSANLNFRLKHGFQVVFFELTISFDEEVTSGVSVQLSNDSTTWIAPTTQSVNGNLIELKFDMQEIPFRGGEIYARISLNGDQQISVNNFNYTSYFQINRLALPQLTCGNNVLAFLQGSQEPEIDVQVDVAYKERTDTPPRKIERPLFPKDKEVVYGYVDKLQWTKPVEGIVNYEILLTADTLSAIPLAPNFTAYTNGASLASLSPNQIKDDSSEGRKETVIDEEGKMYEMNIAAYVKSKPVEKRADYFRASEESAKRTSVEINSEFVINEEGFLNSGQTYFWKVRALSADGLWGPWSNYFSFTMKKIMPPVNLSTTFLENDEILSWNENTDGSRARKFEVYASDEYMGFEPSAANLWITTEDTLTSITDCPYTFFRVIAVDSLGYKSETSEYTNRAYPYLNSSPQPVYANSNFEFQFSFNAFYIPFITATDDYLEVTDVVSHSIVKMPPWLTYNPATRSVVGKPNEEDLRNEFYAGKNWIEVEVSSKYLLPTATRNFKAYLDYRIKNNKPVIDAIDTLVFSNNEFNFSISYSDEDVVYGDSVSFRLRNQPSWLNYITTEDKLLFSGNPTSPEKIISTLTGRDKYGDTTHVEIGVNVVSNVVDHSILFEENVALKVKLRDMQFHESLVIDSLDFSLEQVELNDFSVELINNEFTVTGDFCLIETERTLTLPLTTVINGSQVRFQVILHLRKNNLERPVLAFHPQGSSSILVENLDCDDQDIHYLILDVSGKILANHKLYMRSPQQYSEIDISELRQGIYLMRILSRGKLVTFRFLKT